MHQTVVLVGNTGCGKSTQVPQIILDDYIKRGRGSECRVLVTQPRRLSAIALAERVAEERDQDLGRTVGYQVRLDARFSAKDTRIFFVTVGILLRRLLDSGNLSHYSHIIIDEVHERDKYTDFVLCLLKKLLPQNPHLSLILMSASVEAPLFVRYFSLPPVNLPDAPRRGLGQSILLEIESRLFPIDVFYLEDLVEATGWRSGNF
jgi:HrpA-like RNA helicase